eukprot:CAMPEP_0178963154 /NCGR_PEP_ID=MMETSP0789-20121207/14840_1 /TAXON_ID=3005 /ORGANISM="Rhizosolenia setigera, Strain CCMP 1694" /LENGTH=268 /DNA_ID=CAMNT_0020647539 /DNA_START=76 /DNA_END=882 /DNA_ORIENTATION=-
MSTECVNPPPLEKFSNLSLLHDDDSNNNKNNHFDNEEEEEEDKIKGIKFVNYKNEEQLDTLMELVGRDLSEPYSIFTYRYFLHQWPNLCILALSEETGALVGCVVCKIDEEPSLGGLSANNNAIHDSNTVSSTNNDGGRGNEDEEEIMLKNVGSSDTDTGSSQSASAVKNDNNNNNNVIRSGYMAMLAVEKSYRRCGIGSALVCRIVKRMRKMGCSSVTLETEVTNKAAMRLYEERLGFIREELLVRYYLNWGDAFRLRLWFDEDRDD